MNNVVNNVTFKIEIEMVGTMDEEMLGYYNRSTSEQRVEVADLIRTDINTELDKIFKGKLNRTVKVSFEEVPE